MYSQDHDRIAHKTASYIEKNCSLNESWRSYAVMNIWNSLS